MRKGIMDDRDVERATQEISNDIKEGQWKIREYNRSVAGRKNKNHASVNAIHDLKKCSEDLKRICRRHKERQGGCPKCNGYLSEQWSMERTVNKTKAIKRQMFNRANITLLVNKLISLNT